MFPSLRRALVGAAAFALSLSSFAVDLANAYPDQPIKIIVTFPPGGSADIVIRALQPVVSETLRQTIVIENKAGAGGNIGIGAVAQAAPDGYTLGVAAAGVLTVNPHLNRAAMAFDPLKDLAPVTMLAEIPFVLVASQQSGINSVTEFDYEGQGGTAGPVDRPWRQRHRHASDLGPVQPEGRRRHSIDRLSWHRAGLGRRPRRPHPARGAGYPRVQAIDQRRQVESARRLCRKTRGVPARCADAWPSRA